LARHRQAGATANRQTIRHQLLQMRARLIGMRRDEIAVQPRRLVLHHVIGGLQDQAGIFRHVVVREFGAGIL
jgi:hypothetical protein